MNVAWWDSDQWRAYEEEYNGQPGERAALLSSGGFDTRIVDLRQSDAELWAGVRRSYHSLINKLGREYPEDSLSTGARRMIGGREILAEQLVCKAMHEQHAGKQTRSDATWVMQSDWVRDGYGMLALATISDGMMNQELLQGYAFFVVSENWAYYFSGVSGEKNLGLALIWWSMLTLREHGIRWVELGYQGEAKNEKGRNLEFTRCGFGGRDVPARFSGRALTTEEWEDATQNSE